ncbi:uncharacterized protein FIBRA_05113 [Fibroporia radiculosa]|uniref:Uncharacterized protein n=1 Tax=Fibroporia radiculosa TaxID=599839 RepID=J4G8K3_9APHY|nr:uncharacterized protein FIBRA_05113 [Fibroporia radiculosa]CCM02998.1 predicted protein [Fibroporia radiculosa]
MKSQAHYGNTLEVGHGVDFDAELPSALDSDDDSDETNHNVDEEALAMEREASLIMSYRKYFRRVRDTAPTEVKKKLEIPYYALSIAIETTCLSRRERTLASTIITHGASWPYLRSQSHRGPVQLTVPKFYFKSR